MPFKIQWVKKKKKDIKEKQYKDFSKRIVNRVSLLSFLVIAFICYEVHITQDMTVATSIIDGAFGLLKVVVTAYMVRALFKDKANVDVFFSEQLSKLKKKFGDDFVQDKVEGVDTNILS